MAKMKKSKEDYGRSALELGVGILGGVGANMGTTVLEKQSFMGKAAPYSSAIIATLGMGAYLLMPRPDLKESMFMSAGRSFALGMAIVGGTETGEMLLLKAGIMQGLGFSNEQLGIGFTGKPLPNDSESFNVGNVSIR